MKTPKLFLYSFSFLLLSISFTQAAILDNLVAFYEFEGNADDSSGNEYHGTVNQATLVNGKNGLAYDFENAGYIDLGNIGSPVSGTIEHWFKSSNTSSSGYSYRFTDSINSNTNWSYFNVSDSEVSFGIRNQGQTNIAQHNISISSDEWHHIAGTWGNDGMKLYLDGSLVATNSYSGGIENYTRVLLGPASKKHQSFNGTIDEFAIYNTSLSSSEISQLASGLRPEFDQTSSVPEPSTYGLILLGALILYIKRRRSAKLQLGMNPAWYQK